MRRNSFSTRGVSLGSSLLCVVIGGTVLMSVACEAESPSTQRARSGDPRGGDGDPNADGARGDGDGDAYDPQNPTNKGPGHNPAGFAAIAGIMQSRCGECHHAGTWLDIEAGADANTANKILQQIDSGKMPPAPRDRLSAEEVAKIKAWRDGSTPAAAPPESDPSKVTVTQVLGGATLATYKAALPKVGWKRLAKILESSSTLFWDKAAIPPAYQDTVGDGSSLPFGARFNNSGRSLIVPEGKKLFSTDGKAWSFPFGHTAGADASEDAFIVNFMSLPEDAGSGGGASLMPVAYKIETGTTQGLPIKRWNWSFPKGTIVGEIIMVRDASNNDALVTQEIRVRERFADKWATNSFRPFPTAATLSSAIKQKKPTWQTAPGLAKLVAALDDATSLRAKRLDAPAFSNLISLEGFVDAPLPDADDDVLVRDLLKTTTFVGSYGTTWKQNGTQRAFGATGPSATTTRLSIVPKAFDTGLLEVRETTCEKCHNQGGYFIGDLVDQAILYGDVWGVDRIFSFHPFEPSRIDASGNENRSVRTALTSIVVPYNATKHPSSVYSFYRPTP